MPGASALEGEGVWAANSKDGARLVWVPEGRFTMGSQREDVLSLWQRYEWDPRWIDAQMGNDKFIGELHPHEVEVDGFWMYEQPVTIGQYYSFMKETGLEAPVDPAVHGPDNSAWCDGAPLAETEALPVSRTQLGGRLSLLCLGWSETADGGGVGIRSARPIRTRVSMGC